MASGDELEVTPEPPAGVADAIASALRRNGDADESPWWRAGVEESLRDDAELE